jgi:hypothetical protein
MNTKDMGITVHIFNVVYSLVQKNRPMSDIDAAPNFKKRMELISETGFIHDFLQLVLFYHSR